MSEKSNAPVAVGVESDPAVVVWPDPSPLSRWWEAVMRDGAAGRAGAVPLLGQESADHTRHGRQRRSELIGP